MANNNISDIIYSSLNEVKQIVDANTVIGEPIITPQGTTIIPVSKVMVGVASGGLDYIGKNLKKAAGNVEKPANLPSNFGGGGGTGVTVTPVGFLVVSPSGTVELLNIGANAAGNDKIESISNLIERSPDVISKIANIFQKNVKKSKEEPEETSEESAE